MPVSALKYAIVKSGSQQFRVEEGSKIDVQLLDAQVGSSLVLDKVLLVKSGDSLKVGAPFVKDAQVKCTVAAHGRHDKIIVFKYLRKNKSKKTFGHKQHFTTVTVDSIIG